MDNSILSDFMALAVFIGGFAISYWVGLRIKKITNRKIKYILILSIYIGYLTYIFINNRLYHYYRIEIPYIFTEAVQALFLGITICLLKYEDD